MDNDYTPPSCEDLAFARRYAGTNPCAEPDAVALVAYTVEYHTAVVRVDTTITNLTSSEVEAFAGAIFQALASDAFRLTATRCLHALVAEAYARKNQPD